MSRRQSKKSCQPSGRLSRGSTGLGGATSLVFCVFILEILLSRETDNGLAQEHGFDTTDGAAVCLLAFLANAVAGPFRQLGLAVSDFHHLALATGTWGDERLLGHDTFSFQEKKGEGFHAQFVPS